MWRGAVWWRWRCEGSPLSFWCGGPFKLLVLSGELTMSDVLVAMSLPVLKVTLLLDLSLLNPLGSASASGEAVEEEGEEEEVTMVVQEMIITPL